MTNREETLDCISRQAVIDSLYDWSNHSITDAETWHLRQVIGDIKSMPSVTPQEPKTGHWICHEEEFNALGIAIKGGVKCSECSYTTHNILHMEIGCPFRFCPNCGARMIEPQESEDKE